MNLWTYAYPIIEAHPDRKVVLYLNSEVIYAGRIGEIPAKHLLLGYEKSILEKTYLIILLKEKECFYKSYFS